mgnify:CR=1 FL=1
MQAPVAWKEAAAEPAAMCYDVAYADTDAGGIVYHARYVEMAERSRNRAMALLGVPVQEMLARFGVQFLIREVRVVCHRPGFIGDALLLASGITTVSAARVSWRTAISRGGDGLCDVEAQVAAFDPVSRGPCLIPDALMALLGRSPRMAPLRRAPMMKTGL